MNPAKRICLPRHFAAASSAKLDWSTYTHFFLGEEAGNSVFLDISGCERDGKPMMMFHIREFNCFGRATVNGVSLFPNEMATFIENSDGFQRFSSFTTKRGEVKYYKDEATNYLFMAQLNKKKESALVVTSAMVDKLVKISPLLALICEEQLRERGFLSIHIDAVWEIVCAWTFGVDDIMRTILAFQTVAKVLNIGEEKTTDQVVALPRMDINSPFRDVVMFILNHMK